MSTSPVDVIGIGNALVDVIAKSDDGFLSEHDIEKGGMTLIDQARAISLYGHMGPATEVSGGSAANTIAGVALLGGNASFVGKVAADQLGDVFAHDLKSLGVSYETTRATRDLATGRCLILVTPDAERSMSTYLGAGTSLSPDDIDAEQIGAAQVLYMEGYLFDPPAAQQAFYKAAKFAHEAGRKVSLTLSDSFCVERYRAEFTHLVESEVDILFANEDEILSLYQVATFSEAVVRAQASCQIAAITRSEKGAVIISREDVVEVPADRVAHVVDTTGAGDQFAAGFLTGITRSLDLGTCGALGCMAAAEVISHIGARPEADLKAQAKANGLL
jgi:sugar/nucleoside kinase (ribokinase family)